MENVIHTEDEARVCLSRWDETGVWLGLQVPGASMGIVLTRAEAAHMMAGLQALLDKEAA
jgi:hypothetical protein